MTREERELLLTVARVMRARLEENAEFTGRGVDKDDLDALRGALAPFDGVAAEPVNEAAEH